MTDRPTVPDLLKKTRLFGSLSDAERATVVRQMRELAFGPGQAIFGRGDVGKDVFLVIEGRVRLSVLSTEGRELTFAHAAPGDVFGEIAAFDGGVRTADATAVTATRAMALSHASLTKLVETVPTFADAAVAFLCARLRETDLQFEGVALHRIEVRLARFLVGMLRQQEPTGKGPRQTIDIGMSQSELAMLLGASRPKVNAALTLLEDMEAINRRDTVIDCNVEELRRIAELD